MWPADSMGLCETICETFWVETVFLGKIIVGFQRDELYSEPVE